MLFQVEVDAIEIDESIVRVAKEQFNLKPSDRSRIHVVDGLDFIEKCKKLVYLIKNLFPKYEIPILGTSKFDVIILDVDSKDPKVGMSSPPEAFVKQNFLTKISSCLNEKGKFSYC
jgi:spermidine synthase